ncbi:acyltransferase [Vagococcus lutrae]|uniref:acyltransferase n=1 Tax=Vagococcus lutrae TaxID=81947 RepID=UPI0023A9AE37|nr:acyltransferase [Vagococcus lutrae]WEB81769.1 acyltransferase [Vagococcus lutrae]
MKKIYSWFNRIKVIDIRQLGSKRIKIGKNPRFGHHTKFLSLDSSIIKIGNSPTFRNNVSLRSLKHGELIIGDNVFMNNNVSITCMKSIRIENDVRIANNVVIIDHDHDYRNDMKSFVTDNVIIEKGTWIGANVVILRGTHIGEDCVIGAGNVVSGYIHKGTVLYPKNIIRGNENE